MCILGFARAITSFEVPCLLLSFRFRRSLAVFDVCVGINRKVQMKWQKSDDGRRSVLIILKWGGVLTHAGAQQAEELGRLFRDTMYPGESGLLRLHSSFRHDLKVYSSDEGRVQMTAAAFSKGLLDLDGKLTPILASLVRTGSFGTNDMLDDTQAAGPAMSAMKAHLKSAISASVDPDALPSPEAACSPFSPALAPSVMAAIKASNLIPQYT